MQVWFLANPLDKLNLARDSTLFWASLLPDYPVFWIDKVSPEGIYSREIKVRYPTYDFETPPEINFGNEKFYPWSEAKGILYLRLDPPVDETYRKTMSIISCANQHLNIANSPLSLGSLSEKMIPLAGGDQIPFSFQNPNKKGLVIKNLWGYGGDSVRLSQGNENLSNQELVQDFEPLIAKGERRVFIVGKEVIGTLVKTPTEKDFRSNLQWGASLAWDEITEHEIQRASFYRDWLSERGIYLSAVDFIGEKIVEVNITCPGLLYPSALLQGYNLKKWCSLTDSLLNLVHSMK